MSGEVFVLDMRLGNFVDFTNKLNNFISKMEQDIFPE